MSRDLLKTAVRPVAPQPGQPRQSDLKHAVSTAYYALFHAIGVDCADRFIETGRQRSERAWAQVFRALQQGEPKSTCGQLRKLGFPATLIGVGSAFSALQEQRHEADYNPFHRLSRSDVLAAIALAEQGTTNLHASSYQDRKNFAALLLFRQR